jgi:CheY-like chemotaxis protein
MELEPFEFDLRDALVDTLNTLAIRAHHKGLELACDVQRDVPDRVTGDLHRLRQVLVNLVGNAIKFTERGEVVLAVRLESQRDNEAVLQFAVSDSGIGIPEDKLQHIFQPFRQADNSTSRKYGGTGLGLAISQQLVSLMGGTLRVRSIAGTGSTFSFTTQMKKATAEPRSRNRTAELEGVHVMVCDDSKTSARILQEMLEGWKMEVSLVSNIDDALALLHRASGAGKPIELVIGDASSPASQGVSLARQVRDDATFGQVPILLLTTAACRLKPEETQALAISGQLLKPVKPSQLLLAMQEALKTGNALMTIVWESDTTASHVEPRKYRILLAEDNAVNQKFAVRTLTKQGHTVEVAGTGAEALEKWRAAAFDVILMDVQMPEMDGFDATAEIRRQEVERGTRIPIIAMTAHALTGYREKCLAAGMDGYVTKPIQAATMFAEVDRVMNELSNAATRTDLTGVSESLAKGV